MNEAGSSQGTGLCVPILLDRKNAHMANWGTTLEQQLGGEVKSFAQDDDPGVREVGSVDGRCRCASP